MAIIKRRISKLEDKLKELTPSGLFPIPPQMNVIWGDGTPGPSNVFGRLSELDAVLKKVYGAHYQPDQGDDNQAAGRPESS